ncbi:zinc-binding dehydrogenase [Alkalicoccus urumqiensis]|uniref:Zinc-binding alcohol dehydrogenase n=1 Tax=Alkalicoccus urumqiensis TaxID=1548213 RepID=A0A2P6MF06_ALKUR|nr:zinc-binding dehydrogenase [Alkalicoccus urumqiensis]PRO64827.1 zinc-binding alcohol dehydrogenase [Alkalicoccus urumqiensis]
MKALLLEEAGKWREMEIGEVDTPAPQKGELLVRIHAAGLNPVDYKSAENGIPAWEYPHVLGLDAAGTVESTGEDVTDFEPGDPVMFLQDMTSRGAFAEFATAKAHTAVKIPYNVVYADAAALPVAAFTAYQALFHRMRVAPGESILIHAGAGGVGSFAVQLAKEHGLTVYTTASEENHAFVKELGADIAIDYKEESFVDRVQTETGGTGVDHILDTVGGSNAEESLRALSFNGSIAFMAGAPDINGSIDFSHPKSFHHIALGSVYQSGNVREEQKLAEMGRTLLDKLSNGKLSVHVTQKVPMVDIPKALQQLEERHVRGKIVAEW